MHDKPIKAMILSLGGTPAPVIHSLKESRPEYICFFVSEDTEGSIDEVLQSLLPFRPRHYEWIVTPNPGLLSDCYDIVAREFPPLLQKWGILPCDYLMWFLTFKPIVQLEGLT